MPEQLPVIVTPFIAVDIAVDWITDKIYWTVNSCIMVYDLQSRYQTTVINYTLPAFFYQVEVDPNTRYSNSLVYNYCMQYVHQLLTVTFSSYTYYYLVIIIMQYTLLELQSREWTLHCKSFHGWQLQYNYTISCLQLSPYIIYIGLCTTSSLLDEI